MSQRARSRLGLIALYAVGSTAALGCGPRPSAEEGIGSVRLRSVVSPEVSLDAPVVGPLRGRDHGGRIASNGTAECLVWENTADGVVPVVELGVIRTTAGTLSATSALAVAPAGAHPAVASDSADFLVAWSETKGIRAARASATGAILDASPLVLSTETSRDDWPAIAWTGSEYLVVWQAWNESAARSEIAARRIGTDGTALEASTPLSIAAGSGEGERPAVACGAGECVVAWVDGTDLFGTRVTALQVEDPAGVHIGRGLGPDTMPRVVFDGTNFVVAWDTHQVATFSESSDVNVARVSSGGALMDDPPIRVTSGCSGTPCTALHWQPSLASDGAGTLVAWTDQGGKSAGSNEPPGDVRAVRLDASGAILDATPIDVASGVGDQGGPAAVFGAGSYVVAFSDSYYEGGEPDLLARRVDTKGSVLDSVAVLVSLGHDEEFAVSLATAGSGWLTAWVDTRDVGRGALSVRGARIDDTSRVLDASALPLARNITPLTAPTLTPDGTGYLLAWADGSSLDPSGYVVPQPVTTHVARDGTLTDATPSVVPAKGNPPYFGYSPAVACAAQSCAAAWLMYDPNIRDPNGDTDLDVYSTVWNPDFEPTSDSLPVVVAPKAQDVLGLAASDDQYLVVWYDDRYATERDVYATRLSPSTGVLDPSGILLSTSGKDDDDRDPKVAFDVGRYLVVWERSGDIRGALVDPAGGAVSDFVLSAAPGAQRHPAVTGARDGHNFFVTWEDARSGSNDVYGTWVGHDGHVIAPAGFAIADSSADENRPAVAANAAGRVAVGYEVAAPATERRVAARFVEPLAVDGTACTSPAGCASQLCIDGFCCERACDASCETCGAPSAPGQCTCSGRAGCASNPACAKDTGVPCSLSTECASGFCVDGVCCESRCGEGCDVCDATPGKCTLLAAGARGACGASYLCDGRSASCPSRCDDDSGCAPGSYCADHACAPYCGSNADCPTGSRCDVRIGKCFTGAVCDGDHTLLLVDGSRDCGDYRCTPQGACLGHCKTSADCVEGRQCDDRGECAKPRPAEHPPAVGCACRTGAPGRDPRGSGAAAALAAAVVWLGGLRRAARRKRRIARAVTRIAAVLLLPCGLVGCTSGSSPKPRSEGVARVSQPFEVSPSVALDAPVTAGLLGPDDAARIADNGSFTLVVWNNAPEGTFFGSGSAVYAIRVAKDGRPMDTYAWPIAQMGRHATVASDGNGFFVAWSTEIGGSQGDILGARLDATGALLDTTPIVVSDAPETEIYPSVGFDGTSYLVVWELDTPGADPATSDFSIRAARVSSSGALLDSQPRVLGTGTDASLTYANPRLACAVVPRGCFATWSPSGIDLVGTRVGSNATALDAPPVKLATGIAGESTGTRSGITFDGTNYVAIWSHGLGAPSPLGREIRAARVSPAGVLIDASPVTVATATSANTVPWIASDGNGSLAVWLSSTGAQDDVHGTRLDSSLARLDAKDIVITNTTYEESLPKIASGPAGYLAVWTANEDLFASRIASGVPEDAPPILYSSAPNDETQPIVASDGAGYFVGWADDRADVADGYGVNLAGDAKVIDGAASPFAAASDRQLPSSIAFRNGSYLLAWADYRAPGASNSRAPSAYVGLVPARDPGGVLEDPATSNGGVDGPSIACDPSGDCLLAWSQMENGDSDVFAVRVSDTGAPLGAAFPVATGTDAQTAARVVWGGTAYFAVWQVERTPTVDVVGTRVSPTGEVLDPAGIVVSDAGTPTNELVPKLAFDGKEYLVVWQEQGITPGSSWDVWGTRVLGDGTVLDSAAIAVAAGDGDQKAPDVVYSGDGHNFLVAWEDASTPNTDIRGARVNRDGTLVDPSGFSIADSPSVEHQPALASRGGGHALVAYSAVSTDTTSGRILVRLVDSDALDGTSCTSDGDCASRHCVDSVCCEQLCDGACETCAAPGALGTCTCTGLATCASNPSCKIAQGIACSRDVDCGTGHCADGACCESACNGACDVCNETPGTCTAAAPGSTGVGCGGYLCDGTNSDCPASCASEADCASTHYCSPSHACELRCTGDAQCPPESSCNTETGRCRSGATCDGDHELTLASGKPRDCAPYRCFTERGFEVGACFTRCATSADCVPGSQCDDQGRCASPATLSLGVGVGCGCHAAPHGGGPGAFGSLFVLACLAWSRRRGAGAALALLISGTVSCARVRAHPDESVEVSHPDGGDADAGIGARGNGGLAAPCRTSADCREGFCAGGACATSCTTREDCPPSPEWDCAPVPPIGTLCRCAPSGPDVCNGRDDDCNGVVDDGADCPAPATCVAGACTCPKEDLCGDRCVDQSKDPQNCGACGVACPPNATCDAGACRCLPPFLLCGDACVDISSSHDNCGDCGKACGSAEVCDAGQCRCGGRVCGVACVDTASDAANCGRCGHDCGGATCSVGLCDSLVVDDSADPQFLALDAVNVYSGRCDLRKIPLAGGVPTVLASYGGANGIRGIAVDATNVYFCTNFGFVKSVPVASGAPVATPACTTASYDDAGTVIAETADDGSGRGDFCEGLAMDASSLYFADTTALYKVAKSGGPVATLATLPSPYATFVLASTSVYIGAWDLGLIWKTSVSGGPLDIIATGQLGVLELSADSSYVYWTAAGALSRYPRSGGTVTPIAQSLGQGVTADSDGVYFCDATKLKKFTNADGSVSDVTSDACGQTIAVDDRFVYFRHCPNGNCVDLRKVVKP